VVGRRPERVAGTQIRKWVPGGRVPSAAQGVMWPTSSLVGQLVPASTRSTRHLSIYKK
jgi:hypothetical protein